MVDGLVISAFAVPLQEAGYLAIAGILYAVASYAVGMPAAARVLFATALVSYPVARVWGFHLAGVPVPWGLLAVETLFTFGLAWQSILPPAGITRRLRRVRAALARMERGDFTQPLSTRSLDDLGFLSVSVNSMARSPSSLVGDIQNQAQSLAALSDELAATAQEVHASAEEVGGNTSNLAADAERQRTLVERGRDTVHSAAGANRALRQRIGPPPRFPALGSSARTRAGTRSGWSKAVPFYSI